jgi:hypothetical protein
MKQELLNFEACRYEIRWHRVCKCPGVPKYQYQKWRSMQHNKCAHNPGARVPLGLQPVHHWGPVDITWHDPVAETDINMRSILRALLLLAAVFCLTAPCIKKLALDLTSNEYATNNANSGNIKRVDFMYDW